MNNNRISISQTILAIFFVLIVMEIFAAFTFNFIEKPKLLFQQLDSSGYAYEPYIGFRSNTFPIYGEGDAIDSKSLVILGSSAAAGVGTKELDSKYYVLLDNYFKKNPDFGFSNIVNYAVPGFVSIQEALTFRNYIFMNEKKPRLVISITGFNDTYFYLFRELNVGDHEFQYPLKIIFQSGYESTLNLIPSLKNLIRKTNIFALVHRLTTASSDESVPPIYLFSSVIDPKHRRMSQAKEEVIKKSAAHFLSNILSTALLAKSKNIKYYVILQPNYLYGGALTLQDNEWFSDMPKLMQWVSDYEFQKPAYDEFFFLIVEGLKKYEKDGIIYFSDYRSLFKEAVPTYHDPVHFNKDGSKIFVNQLLNDIRNKIFKNTNGGVANEI